jgi:glycosyltransferase involved in cell wall biosynthesis
VNVTLLTDALSERSGGLYRAVINLVSALASETTLRITIKCPREATTYVPDQLPNLSVETFESIRFLGFGVSLSLRAALLNDHVDLVHLHGLWTFQSVICNDWHRSTNGPYIVSPHGMLDRWALSRSRAKKAIATFLYQRKCLASAACIHALSVQEMNAIRDYEVRAPILVQANGVETLTKDALEQINSKRLRSRERSLLFLGRLHSKKGVLELLEGWNMAKQRGMPSTWRLIICGWSEGGYRIRVEHMVHRLGLAGSVQLLGGLAGDDKLALLNQADAFILPSYSEGLPLAVLEAWAHGLPVIMTPECNLPDGFSQGAAFKCAPDPESIADAIASLSSLEDNDRQLMGIKGYELVRRKYSPISTAQSLLSAYRWASGQGPRPENLFM